MHPPTDRELPEFTTMLREMSVVIDKLMEAASRRARRGQQKDALQLAVVADSLDLARDMVTDLQGLDGPELPAPPPSTFSPN